MSVGGGQSSSSTQVDPTMQSINAQTYGAAQRVAGGNYTPYTGQNQYAYKILVPQYQTGYWTSNRDGHLTGPPVVNWTEETRYANPQAEADARVAGFTPDQQEAFRMARQFARGNVGGDMLDAGIGANTQAMLTSMQAATGMPGHDLAPYMNPYIDYVAGNTMSQLERARDAAITSGQAKATAAGAYGGSRHGVADSLTNREFADTTGSTMGQLYKQGFDTATGLQQLDLNRQMLAADAFNKFGESYQDFGNNQRINSLQNYQLMSGIGQQQQDQAQKVKDAAATAADYARDYELRQLSILQGAQSGMPYGTTTTQNLQRNRAAGAMGGALAGASMYSALGASNPYLAAAMMVGGGLLGGM